MSVLLFVVAGVLHLQGPHYWICWTSLCQLWLWWCSTEASRVPDGSVQRLFPYCSFGWVCWECPANDFWDFLPNTSVHQHWVSCDRNELLNHGWRKMWLVALRVTGIIMYADISCELENYQWEWRVPTIHFMHLLFIHRVHRLMCMKEKRIGMQ